MATKSAHTEVPAGGKPNFPPFQRETFASQFIWLALTFAILYVLVAKLIRPRIDDIFAARSERIAKDIAAAASSKEQSDAAIAAYEQALADARGRAQAMANEMRDQQAAAAAATRKRLAAQLDARLAQAEKTIAATKEAAMANVRGIAVDTAGAIVERLTGASPSQQDVAAAVSAVLKR